MKTKARSLFELFILLAIISGNALADAAQDISDARQETQIWTTYALSPYLRANDLKVAVHEGKATLTGVVDEDVNKDLAKQIALGVEGVKSVENNILVQQDYIPSEPSAIRRYGDMIDDTTITAAVKSKLLWSKYADGLATEVVTKGGKVTLTGTADSSQGKNMAKRLAVNTRGVVSVDDQLVVSPKKAAAADKDKGAAKTAGTAIEDSWITTKVKSTFMYSKNVDSSDILVSTKSHAVTLTGKVASGAERALAIELAKNVRGVKTVHSNGLTY